MQKESQEVEVKVPEIMKPQK